MSETAPTTPKITIIKEDAEVFLAFQKHRHKFVELLDAGVFDLVSGQVNLNINNGQIQQVYVNQLTYKRTAV